MTSSDAQPQQADQGPQKAILIVDDEAATRTLLKKTVQSIAASCNILEAADGDSALKLAKTSRPDLVLLDIVLPGSSTSGVLLCQEFCRMQAQVIIVSGNATGPIAQACLAMGASEILRKPFSVEAAKEMLVSYLA